MTSLTQVYDLGLCDLCIKQYNVIIHTFIRVLME